MGLNIAVFGNHEFDFDSKHFTATDLSDRVSESNFSWLASNLIPSGIFGDQVRTRHTNCNGVLEVQLSSKHSIFLFGLLYESEYPEVGRFADPISRCQDLIGETKNMFIERDGFFKPARTTLVALTHQDLSDDIKLAQECPHLRLIMGGHDHEVLRKVLNENGCLIVKAMSNARTLRLNFVGWLPREVAQHHRDGLGKLDASFLEQAASLSFQGVLAQALRPNDGRDQSNDPELMEYLARLSDAVQFDLPGLVVHDYKDDGCAIVSSAALDTMHPGFSKLVEPDKDTNERILHWTGLSDEHKTALTFAPVDLDTDDDSSRSRSTNFGNFVTDCLAGRIGAPRDRPRAHVAFINGGSFRLDRRIVKGESITEGTVCDLFFHDNDVRLYEVEGTILKSILERAVGSFLGKGNFLQVSGLEISVVEVGDTFKIKSVIVLGEEGTRRVLEPTDCYDVATTSYVAMSSDAYGNLFSKCNLKEVLKPSVRDALQEEMRARGIVVPADESRWLFVH